MLHKQMNEILPNNIFACLRFLSDVRHTSISIIKAVISEGLLIKFLRLFNKISSITCPDHVSSAVAHTKILAC